jgi:hypothetical protein
MVQLSRLHHPHHAAQAQTHFTHQAPADGLYFAYNALGQTLLRTDQNQTLHTYEYDLLGRLVFDGITIAPNNPHGVDTTVLWLAYTFNSQGLPELFTAGNGQTILNQVRREYNGLGQLTAEYQEHSGAVDVPTTPGPPDCPHAPGDLHPRPFPVDRETGSGRVHAELRRAARSSSAPSR